MNKSKLIIVIALALFAAPFIPACNRAGGAKQKTIAVIPKGVSHSFWKTVEAGANAAGWS